jgi:hypothetical protein
MKYPTIMQKDAKSFSKWIDPPWKYRMACCDCVLVHDFEFRIVLRGKAIKAQVDGRNAQIQFRVHRNNRATAGIRRGMKHEHS